MTTASRNGRAPKSASSARSTSRGTTRSSSHSAQMAHKAVKSNATEISLPVVGEIQLPSKQSIAYFGAVTGLVALGLIEWPVALVVGVGHVLAQQHGNSLLEEFGEGLMDA